MTVHRIQLIPRKIRIIHYIIFIGCNILVDYYDQKLYNIFLVDNYFYYLRVNYFLSVHSISYS